MSHDEDEKKHLRLVQVGRGKDVPPVDTGRIEEMTELFLDFSRAFMPKGEMTPELLVVFGSLKAIAETMLGLSIDVRAKVANKGDDLDALARELHEEHQKDGESKTTDPPVH